MKIDHKSLEFRNQNIRNKLLPIPFYMPNNEKKLSPLDYHTYSYGPTQRMRSLWSTTWCSSIMKRETLSSGFSSWKPSC
eukprot:8640097-Ditylum_brightwellii.AAC.1